MPEHSLMSPTIISMPVQRDHGARTFGAALALAALLHVAFALYFSRPHRAQSGGSGEIADINMENVKFQDENIAPEGPVDMSYRPEVANVLPDAGGGGGADEAPKGPVDMSQAKMDEAGLDLAAPGEGGEVLKIGGPTKGLDDLLALPKAGGSGKGRPGVGYRIKTYPPTVPFFKVEVKPKPINTPMPVYPEMVRSAGIEGTAVVEALLDLDGSVMDARILKSSTNQMLDAAAIEASLRAKFTPAKQRDKPVRVWISIPYRFTLKG
jgi:TonB family protein